MSKPLPGWQKKFLLSEVRLVNNRWYNSGPVHIPSELLSTTW